MERDEDHPVWQVGLSPELGAFAGWAGGASLGSAPEQEHAESSAVSGLVAGVRIGIEPSREHAPGLGIEAALGYMRFGLESERRLSVLKDGVRSFYGISDDLRVQGGFATAGVRYRLDLSKSIGIVPRLAGGVLVGQVRDPLSVTVSSGGGGEVYLGAVGGRDALSVVAPFVATEIGLEARLGRVRLGAALGLAVFPLEGPSFDETELRVADLSVCERHPSPTSCAGDRSLPEERAYGPFALWVPQLAAAYVFP